jgi:hypothetical protein
MQIVSEPHSGDAAVVQQAAWQFVELPWFKGHDEKPHKEKWAEKNQGTSFTEQNILIRLCFNSKAKTSSSWDQSCASYEG